MSDYTIKRIDYKDHEIEIWQDESPWNPRDESNVGTMVLTHGRWSVANEINLDFKKFDSWAEVEAHIQKKYNPPVILPVYAYDHSGVGLSTSNTQYPFNCPWDAGQLGFIFARRKDVVACLGRQKYDAESIAKITKCLIQEVETYAKYLNGEVYGYTIWKDEEPLDSCGGFYDTDEAIADAKANID